MVYQLYDYLDNHGANDIKNWCRSQPTTQRAKLNAKLDLLQSQGLDLPPALLSGTEKGHIRKLKVKGNPQLRLMLCKGPLQSDLAFTLLVGAIEKDFVLKPLNAVQIADNRRGQVVSDPFARRCKHERVI